MDCHQNAPKENPQKLVNTSSIVPAKRTATDGTNSTEYDSDEELVNTYTNHDNQSILIPAEKRQRFLDTNRKGFSQTVEDIWHVVGRRIFRHQYGALPEGYIRILIIHPGTYDEPLRATLVAKSLDSDPRYDALSYVWGDDIPLHPVRIFDKSRNRGRVPLNSLHPREGLKRLLIDGGQTTHIRNNLDAALRRIRDPRNRIPIWVDAVCMNQKDSEEKSKQLLRMSEIYSKAQKVRIWLGEANQISNLGMDFITEMVQDQVIGPLLEVRDEKQKVMAFLDLLRSRWFARRWIIQEIFFAKDATLHFGEKSHNYKDFLLALTRVMKRLLDPDTRMKEIDGVRSDALETLEAYGANTLKKLHSELLETNARKVLQPLKSLDYLIIRLGAFDAGDPRDIIYGVLSLALKRHEPALPIPDYSSSVLDVFAKFVEYTYNTTHQLCILCKHWAPVHTWHFIYMNDRERRRVDTVLPTWISQLDKASFGTPDDGFLGRKEALPLVGETTRTFDASKGATDIVVRFGKRDLPNTIEETSTTNDALRTPSRRILLVEEYDGTLTVKGLIIGRIRERSDRMLPEIIPRDVIAMGGWKDSRSDKDHFMDDVPHRLVRSLIAHHDGRTIDISDQKACLDALKKEDRHGDIRIEKLLSESKASLDPDLKRYLERARKVCWNRRAFLADSEPEEDELFGLCPDQTQVKDLVCIIYGCSVPVILRESNDPPQLGFKLRPELSSAPTSRKPTRKHTKARRPSNKHTSRVSQRYSEGRFTRSPSAEPHLHPDTSPLSGSSSQHPIRSAYYRLIGECYVDRFMDGRAIGRETFAHTESEFTLV